MLQKPIKVIFASKQICTGTFYLHTELSIGAEFNDLG